MAKLRFLGQAAWEVTTSEGKVLYFDPWLDPNPVSPIKAADVKKADLVFVTHGHSDHLGDAFSLVQNTGATLICNPELGFKAEAEAGIRYDVGSYPVHIGGSATVKGVSFHVTDANHTADPGDTLGFVVEVEPGARMYHAGDTGVFGDMALIGQLYSPQLALLPIGGRYTMGPREAALAAQLLQVDVVIPMHYNTFPDQQRQSSEEFVALVKAIAPKAKVLLVEPGQVIEYPGC